VFVNYDNLWLCYVGSALLIVNLYTAKDLILRKVAGAGSALFLFSLLVLPSIPLTWALTPDWSNKHVYRIARSMSETLWQL